MSDTHDSGDSLLVIRSDPDHRPQEEVRWEWREARAPYGDEYVTTFVVCAHTRSARVEQAVRTLGGDGLADFLDALAEDYAGWVGVREWRSIDHELTVSAEHRGHVRLRWGLARWNRTDTPSRREWLFEASTVHEAGESMRTLAGKVREFLDVGYG